MGPEIKQLVHWMLPQLQLLVQLPLLQLPWSFRWKYAWLKNAPILGEAAGVRSKPFKNDKSSVKLGVLVMSCCYPCLPINFYVINLLNHFTDYLNRYNSLNWLLFVL